MSSNSALLSSSEQRDLIHYANQKISNNKCISQLVKGQPSVTVINPNAAPDHIRYNVSWVTQDNWTLSVECICKHPSFPVFLDMGLYFTSNVTGERTRLES